MDPEDKISNSFDENTQKKLKLHFLMIGLMVLVAGIFAVRILLNTQCTTEKCFVEKANSCREAYYSADKEGIGYTFYTKDCLFKKTLISLPKTEPDLIRQMVENKSMACGYEKDMFDARLVETLGLGIENCKGELKDSLIELAVAKYELDLE